MKAYKIVDVAGDVLLDTVTRDRAELELFVDKLGGADGYFSGEVEISDEDYSRLAANRKARRQRGKLGKTSLQFPLQSGRIFC